MQVFNICDFIGFLLVSYCAVPTKEKLTVRPKNQDKFEVEYEWSHVNFTWRNLEEYIQAVEKEQYIPENNAMAGIKIYKNKMYIALPRIRKGTPVTLAVVSTNTRKKKNQLLVPFPSWKMNVQDDCSTLQNVQSMEIDRKGIMWVLDGNRFNDFTKCPAKLVLLDLNNKGKVVHTFVFPNELCSVDGGFLNDIVIDESDGGFAFMTENSQQDPGIVVYSRLTNKAWKLRDKTMYAEISAANFTVDGLKNTNLVHVDGIALEPIPKRRDGGRYVYYCPLTAFNMYGISNIILKNEQIGKSGVWRRYIRHVGKKQGQSDGLAMDNRGNLYYGLLNLYGVAKWNIYNTFNTSKIIDTNEKTIIWPDSFAFDNEGYLFVLANGIHKFFNPFFPLQLSSDVKFRVLRLYTASKSYLYE